MTIAVDSDIKPQSSKNEFELEHDKTDKMTYVPIDQSLQGTDTILFVLSCSSSFPFSIYGTDQYQYCIKHFT